MIIIEDYLYTCVQLLENQSQCSDRVHNAAQIKTSLISTSTQKESD